MRYSKSMIFICICLVSQNGCNNKQDPVDPYIHLNPHDGWGHDVGSKYHQTIYPWSHKKYPDYGMLAYYVDYNPTTAEKEIVLKDFENALKQCRYVYSDAYKNNRIDHHFVYVTVVISDASNDKHKIGAIFNMEEIMKDDADMHLIVKDTSFATNIEKYLKDINAEGGFSAEKDLILPYVEEHMKNNKRTD